MAEGMAQQPSQYPSSLPSTHRIIRQRQHVGWSNDHHLQTMIRHDGGAGTYCPQTTTTSTTFLSTTATTHIHHVTQRRQCCSSSSDRDTNHTNQFLPLEEFVHGILCRSRIPPTSCRPLSATWRLFMVRLQSIFRKGDRRQ